MVDGQEVKQDSTPTSANPQETSQKASKTYSESEVEKLVSDRLAKAGREAKALEAKEAQLRRDAEELERWRKEREQQDEEKFRDNPDALTLYRTRKELERKEKEIEQKRLAVEADRNEVQTMAQTARETLRKTTISELSTKYGFDAKLLDKPYLKSTDELEDYAKAIASIKPVRSQEPPDSGLANAGGGTPTAEQMEKMTPDEYAEWRLKTLDPKRKR